ncbi:hypothetical protein HYPSUDRAFT_194600 [Hypholoma sublateritium FD-334 SS-4]|uniref:Uncharacterized protein n=1 Tax=Hypholoma sublateritium (strain FD-334 SS-4) TaxID=945553 RepID=A0A0D2N7Z6_HYPSF|nr:hypothetical protein HYPSUDRAFT_194600 [Hypholoma sublateritium FD-334 SS-4]
MSKSTLIPGLLLLLCLVSLLHSFKIHMFVRRRLTGNVAHYVDVYHIGPQALEPVALPVKTGRVLMRTNPVTARYNVTTAEAAQEWIVALPSGDGSYRLHSPQTKSEANRAVFVSMYHEIHCIQTFAVALVENQKEQWPHFRHCFNYIRQMVMCRPDLTVEAGRFVDDQFVTTTPGSVHVCQDWRIPHDFLDTKMPWGITQGDQF